MFYKGRVVINFMTKNSFDFESLSFIPGEKREVLEFSPQGGGGGGNVPEGLKCKMNHNFFLE